MTLIYLYSVFACLFCCNALTFSFSFHSLGVFKFNNIELEKNNTAYFEILEKLNDYFFCK